MKDGKTEDLVYAEVIEDHQDKVDPEDDPDKNKTADEEGENWELSRSLVLKI